MKSLPWILVGVLAVVSLLGWFRPGEKEDAVAMRDTIIIRDTVRDSIPKPLLVRFDHWDSIPFPLTVHDTVRDTIYIPIPIERKEYLTDDYRAIVSGYRPRLELMEVFRRTQTVTLTPKTRRWGLGVQAGVGWPSGWYVGIGVQYDLWQW